MTAIFLFFYFIFSKKKKRTSIALFRSRIILLPENTFSASRSKNTKTKNKKIKSLWPFASRHRCTSSHQEPTCSSQIGEWKSDKKHTNYFLFLMKKKKKKKTNNRRRFTWRRWWETLESWPWVLSHWRRQRSIEVCERWGEREEEREADSEARTRIRMSSQQLSCERRKKIPLKT